MAKEGKRMEQKNETRANRSRMANLKIPSPLQTTIYRVNTTPRVQPWGVWMSWIKHATLLSVFRENTPRKRQNASIKIRVPTSLSYTTILMNAVKTHRIGWSFYFHFSISDDWNWIRMYKTEHQRIHLHHNRTLWKQLKF